MHRLIHEERGRALLKARRSVHQRIHGGARSAQGTQLRDLPYNNRLICGPDFGGKNNDGIYWPAMKRYRGRFYQEIDPDESGVLGESPHHWLIVSALYGLLTPAEPIQIYSCHTLDDEGIASIWTHDHLLTSLLLEYVHVSNVTLIVDLTADVSYHELFNWERVRRTVRVLRAFGEQNAGPSLLPALGFLVRDRLLKISAEELTGIENPKTYITDYEDIVLTPDPIPPPPFLSPSEEEPLPSGEEPIHPPQPSNEPHEGCVVLQHSREIPITGGDHETIFGRPIHHIRDLPPEPRRLFDTVSRAAEVLSVHLGRREPGRSSIFSLDLVNYRQGQGYIDGRLRGPGTRGGVQRFRIRVTPGREQATYLAISRLLAGEVE